MQEKINAWTYEVASSLNRRDWGARISESTISLRRTIDRSAVDVYKLLKHFPPIMLAL